MYHFEGKEKYPKVINFWVFFEKIEETCSIPSIKVHWMIWEEERQIIIIIKKDIKRSFYVLEYLEAHDI